MWWRSRLHVLEHLSPAWFVPAMGWTGLGLSWARAIQGLGEPAHLVALACASLASLMLVGVGLGMALRWRVHPAPFWADAGHPVKHTFWSALPIGMVLLAALWISLTHVTHVAMTLWWGVGALGELATTLWVIARWLRPKAAGGTPLSALTPVIFLPLVGNLLVPWAGVPLGHLTWSSVQMGLGLLLWPVGFTLLWVRLRRFGPLPAHMTPTWFILVVPPSAAALSLSLFDPPGGLLWTLWGIAAACLMWALTQLKTIVQLEFGLPHWGMSFPLAAFSALCLKLGQTPEGGWLLPAGQLAVGITTLVILWLSIKSLQGLLNGHLLQPEG